MADFLKAYAPVKQWEGGWCDVPGDAGGETYAGIARNFFPKWRGWPIIDAAKTHSSFRAGSRAFSGHLDTLPALRDLVTDFYRREWWDRMRIAHLPQNLANELFEQAVNLGRGGAGKLLQRLCNAMNYDQTTGRPLFDDLAVDGVAGPKTLAALARILEKRPTVLSPMIHGLNCLQGAHYIAVAASAAKKRKFLNGWLTRTHCPE